MIPGIIRVLINECKIRIDLWELFIDFIWCHFLWIDCTECVESSFDCWCGERFLIIVVSYSSILYGSRFIKFCSERIKVSISGFVCEWYVSFPILLELCVVEVFGRVTNFCKPTYEIIVRSWILSMNILQYFLHIPIILYFFGIEFPSKSLLHCIICLRYRYKIFSGLILYDLCHSWIYIYIW